MNGTIPHIFNVSEKIRTACSVRPLFDFRPTGLVQDLIKDHPRGSPSAGSPSNMLELAASEPLAAERGKNEATGGSLASPESCGCQDVERTSGGLLHGGQTGRQAGRQGFPFSRELWLRGKVGRDTRIVRACAHVCGLRRVGRSRRMEMASEACSRPQSVREEENPPVWRLQRR